MSLSKQLNLSFAGCGFLGIYHIGVASCFKEYAPNILVNKLSGASAGAMAACCLLCGVPMGQVTSDILKVATLARNNTFGAFSPGFNISKIIRDRLTEALPSDAHKICTGRLHVSVTKVPGAENVILSEFKSKEELIQAIICSTFIPFFSGYVPEKFRGERYIDGCYSNNLPILDENTITVSPFCGESDICPQDNSYNLFQVNFNNTSIELSPQNLLRIVQILFPPQVEILSDMCKQGFDDALRYLQRNTLVSCVRCIAVNSEVQLEDTLQQSDSESDSECLGDYDYLSEDDDNDYDDDDSVCNECNQRRMLASVDDFPETVLSVLDEAALSMNSGLISWVFKHKSMRVLSVLTLPYVLPFDIARNVYSRFIDIVPKVGNDINLITKWILNYLRNFLKRFTAEQHLYGAKFSCQLAITEYDFATVEQKPNRKRSCSVVALRSPSRRPSLTQRPLSGEWGPCPHRSKRTHNSGSRRMSCVNFGFSVDLAGQLSSSNHPLVKALDSGKLESKVVDLANNTLLNWQSPVLEQCEVGLNSENVDTFEQVLQVTRQQESIMAYYYMDGNNRMQVREIFDASGSPEFPILPPDEYETIRNMEWDEAFNDLSQKSDEDFYGVPTDGLDDDIPEIIVDHNASKAYMSLIDTDELLDDDI